MGKFVRLVNAHVFYFHPTFIAALSKAPAASSALVKNTNHKQHQMFLNTGLKQLFGHLHVFRDVFRAREHTT